MKDHGVSYNTPCKDAENNVEHLCVCVTQSLSGSQQEIDVAFGTLSLGNPVPGKLIKFDSVTAHLTVCCHH